MELFSLQPRSRNLCTLMVLCSNESIEMVKKRRFKNDRRDSLKKHLIKIDRNRSRNTTLDWLPEFVALHCWSLTPSDTMLYGFDLLKGFVPWDLFNLINSITRNSALSTSLINKVLFKLQDRAFRYIWLLR